MLGGENAIGYRQGSVRAKVAFSAVFCLLPLVPALGSLTGGVLLGWLVLPTLSLK